MTAAAPASVLLDPEAAPLRPAGCALALGRVVVVAPHPDDESLGCGGLLGLLAVAGLGPRVVVVTDGSKSHDSPSYPPWRLAVVREREARAAAAALRLGPDAVSFLRLPDCDVPAPGTPEFGHAVGALAWEFRHADTVVVPWRRDPHCDHEACWALARAAASLVEHPVRWLEYPVWAWEQAAAACAPTSDECRAWRLDVSPVLARKRAAVAAHRSQTTRMIADDPDGFLLEDRVLAHFQRPWELYLEPVDG